MPASITGTTTTFLLSTVPQAGTASASFDHPRRPGEGGQARTGVQRDIGPHAGRPECGRAVLRGWADRAIVPVEVEGEKESPDALERIAEAVLR